MGGGTLESEDIAALRSPEEMTHRGQEGTARLEGQVFANLHILRL